MTDTKIKRPGDSDSTCRWLSEAQAAERLNMSVKWLQKARLTGTNAAPRFAKFGSSVRYSVADLEQYERNCLRLSTSDTGLTKKGSAS